MPEVDPTVPVEVGAAPVEVGVAYVAQVLDPYRSNNPATGKPYLKAPNIQTVERLVDLFEPDIKGQQIQPRDFLNVVVGAAAIKGVHLMAPDTPNQFLWFAEQAKTHLDAYYISMIDESELI